jgi:hypothetical protein
MVLQDLVDRFSKFSGWNLQTKISKNYIEFFDPKDWSNSALCLLLEHDGDYYYLHECHLRMKFWGVSLEEKLFIIDLLKNKSD